MTLGEGEGGGEKFATELFMQPCRKCDNYHCRKEHSTMSAGIHPHLHHTFAAQSSRI